MMKWKIGVVLVLLMMLLPVIANAEGTIKICSREEIEAFEEGGGIKSKR